MSSRPRPAPVRDRGLSLVEVIVVVAILSVLAAIVTPVLLNQRRNAEVSATVANLGYLSGVVATAMTTTEGDLAQPTGFIAGGEGQMFDGGFAGRIAVKYGYSLGWDSGAKTWCVQGRESDQISVYHIDQDSGGAVEGPCPSQ